MIVGKATRLLTGLLFVGGLVAAGEHEARAWHTVPGCALVGFPGYNNPVSGCSNTATFVTWGQEGTSPKIDTVTLSGGSTYWSYMCQNSGGSTVISVVGDGLFNANNGGGNSFGDCTSFRPFIPLVNCGGGQSGQKLCNDPTSWSP
ncbi:MAG TPA: hypothetical protein VHU80_08860 [Polyangiaceae bacterium]|jgi:hypothetical protein|nr:hypothetical protein [Polyangiaceae bacterium]